MHDFNQFRLPRQTKAPMAIDEAILREEQRLTYAKDICEAVGLEPQELLEMLQELIELDTHAQRVEKLGPEKALGLAASFKRHMARRNEAIVATGKRDPQLNRAQAMTQAALGADNVHVQASMMTPPTIAFGQSANSTTISPENAQGFNVPGSANVGSLPKEEQEQALRIYKDHKSTSPAGLRRTAASDARVNRAKGIARI